MSKPFAWLLVMLICGTRALAQPAQPAHTLSQVLDRMGEYLKAYESQLSEIVGDERYLQDDSGKKRLLVSEVAFLRLPGNSYWYGVRDIRTVDGQPLPTNGLKLGDLVTASDLTSKAEVIMAASSEQNLGMKRNINMPTVPLEVIRSRPLLTFKDDGAETIRGTRTRRIQFVEVGESTLIRPNGGGFSLKTKGHVWVEPESGRVWRVEIDCRDSGSRQPAATKMTVRVDFGVDSRLGFLVPVEMSETFPAQGTRGKGVAQYSNFRKFGTSARIVPPL